MKTEFTQKESNTIWVMKGLAMLSVFYAHMSGGGTWAEDLRCILGTIGVAAYFVLSGYVFRKPAHSSWKPFWKKKLMTVIVPWLICSALTFALSVVLGSSQLSVTTYLRWTLGVQTWYYFVPMLLICFLIFSLSEKDAFLYICVGITLVSLLLTRFGILKMPGELTNYLNCLNWIGFFALGRIARKRQAMVKPPAWAFGVSALIWIGATVLYCVLPIPKAYWSGYAMLYECISVVFLYCISYALSENALFRDIGKKSYFIYLIHMQIAGILNTRIQFARIENLLTLVKPILAYAVVYALVFLFDITLKKCRMSKFSRILGYR